MADEKKRPKNYVAKVGLDFEGLKGKPRIEPGERLPEGLNAGEIQELLDLNQIEEAQ